MLNRKPNEKLPPEMKSRTYSLRLDPKNIDDLWVIEAIEFYARQDIDLKTLFKDLLARAEGKPAGSSQVKIKARDIADMITTIREMKEMLESGSFSTVGGSGNRPKARRGKPQDIEYSDAMRNTLDKFVNRGFSAAELADEDDE